MGDGSESDRVLGEKKPLKNLGEGRNDETGRVVGDERDEAC